MRQPGKKIFQRLISKTGDGADTSRSSIANFFNNGARARGLVNAGADGIPGNADDTLNATGETLAHIQNRVLGVGVNSAPFYTAVPGYVTLSVRGGLRFGERHEVLLDFQNIGDRNFRGNSWGSTLRAVECS